MFKHRKLAGAALMLAMGAIVAAGCGGGDKKPAANDGKGGVKGDVMVYTSIYPDIIDKMCKPNVAKAFPDMKVTWFQGGTEKVKTKIAGEIKAKKIGADVLMVADPSYYLALKKQGLLLDYVSKNQKDVIADKDKNGSWTAVRISNMIIAYNKDKVQNPPKSWQDLTDPKWKGKIAMPNPMLSGTAYVAVGALADKYGWEYFDKLKANGIRVEEGNSAIQNKLLTGEYAAAMILEENILKLKETKHEPLEVVYPSDGIICVPSPIAIFNTTKNPDGAKALVDWWLSKEGQQAVVKGWMHSVRGDVEPPTGAPKLSTLLPNAVKVNWDKLATEDAKIKEAFRTRVMD
ncbi:MAG: ABC transporter substrate-binding protein [Succiniclasticum sp.]|jgi:extracellular solute-binding protein family 1|nr:ABC transporter substrate-binding protein [Succiniclasticum sp.]MCI6222678.1 ABC transporter substrate-binding protein [Selenomonadales bacterium]MDY2869388.1 ABC transporter substrate-binding protein [Succiniclasticum sp.]MDY6302912.1 ABC transporter substrate-binding protein [Succiniclasticum sp.]MDY6346687.1 ABC transporter substrate-binding protein [Succiniclasticum sp.]